jgi:hypothetical protein
MGHTVGERSWECEVYRVFSVVVMESVLRFAVGENSLSGRVVIGFRGCRCLRGIDCRRPEVDGAYGG